MKDNNYSVSPMPAGRHQWPIGILWTTLVFKQWCKNVNWYMVKRHCTRWSTYDNNIIWTLEKSFKFYSTHWNTNKNPAVNLLKPLSFWMNASSSLMLSHWNWSMQMGRIGRGSSVWPTRDRSQNQTPSQAQSKWEFAITPGYPSSDQVHSFRQSTQKMHL